VVLKWIKEEKHGSHERSLARREVATQPRREETAMIEGWSEEKRRRLRRREARRLPRSLNEKGLWSK
jgi:hypothetical protein